MAPIALDSPRNSPFSIQEKLDQIHFSDSTDYDFQQHENGDSMQTSSAILAIIYRYIMVKFSDAMDKWSEGTPKFLAVIDKHVRAGEPVAMCLPAFPFKSCNKVQKVLGQMPDKAEEVSLRRMNTMCDQIGEIYRPGARLTIISDGLVYNDLLSVPDRDVWAYGTSLRDMAQEKGFNNLSFSRLKDLVSFPLPQDLNEISYVVNATNFRRHLINKFGNEEYDVDNEIATKPDINMTYRGYSRFLSSDLRYIYPVGKERSNFRYKKDVKLIAKEMLKRGDAFAKAVKAAFPDYLRLSIHQSTGEHKISIRLLPTDSSYTTPWHCSVAFRANGTVTSGTAADFKDDPNMEVVYENGKPSYFRERLGVSE